MPTNNNLKKGPWTDAELGFVVANYGKLTTKQMATKLRRAYGGVAYQLQRLRQSGLIDSEIKARPVQIKETTSAVPTVVVKKPWWKFWG